MPVGFGLVILNGWDPSWATSGLKDFYFASP